MDGLAEIEKIVLETAENNRILVGLTRSSDSEVRLRAVEKLGSFTCSNMALDVIRGLISDPDELVRLACLEVLEDCSDLESIPLIRERILDSDWMVRGRAAIALARFGAPDAVDIITVRLSSCSDEEERVRYLAALFFISAATFGELVNAFESAGYRARCAIVHLVADAVYARWHNDQRVVDDVRSFFARRLQTEDQIAVRSALIGALSEIDAGQQGERQAPT